MKTIHKVVLDELLKSQGNKQTYELKLPVVSKIISVAEQTDHIVLYYEVDTSFTGTRVCQISIVGTGHEIVFELNSAKFLGTVKMYSGSLMFHIYEN